MWKLELKPEVKVTMTRKQYATLSDTKMYQHSKFGIPTSNIGDTRNGPAQARVMMKSVLSSAEHGRCPHKYQNWEQLLAFQYLRVG